LDAARYRPAVALVTACRRLIVNLMITG